MFIKIVINSEALSANYKQINGKGLQLLLSFPCMAWSGLMVEALLIFRIKNTGGKGSVKEWLTENTNCLCGSH